MREMLLTLQIKEMFSQLEP